jgi:hypothetical protein
MRKLPIQSETTEQTKDKEESKVEIETNLEDDFW